MHLYSKNVISLMGAYPGRRWRMADVVRYVASGRNEKPNERIRRGVHRVVSELIAEGIVEYTAPEKPGSFGLYRWKQ